MPRRLLPVATAALVALPWALAAAPAQAAASGTSIQFLVDASSGMGAADKGGRPKVETVREALREANRTLGSGVKASLRVYGAQTAVQDPKNPPPSGCDDTQLVAPPSGGTHGKIDDALKKYAAKGYAPIVAGVKGADKDLGNDGNRHIVLVSSGAFGCAPNPCEEIGKLRQAGMTTPIDVIGLGSDKDGAKQLACIASITGGTYVETGDTPGLTNALTRTVARAMRGQDFYGRTVAGSDQPDGGADALGAGAYAATLKNKQARYFRLSVPAGSSLVVSASIRPALPGGYNSNNLRLELLGNGESCSYNTATTTATTSSSGGAMTAQTAYDPQETGRSSNSSRSCQGLTQLVAKVMWNGDDKVTATPVQLIVSQVAGLDEPIGDVAGMSGKGYAKLPAPLDPSSSSLDLAVPSPGAPDKTVVGGSSFITAGELKQGSSRDVVPVGDLAYYKVKLDFGQSAALTVDAPDAKDVEASIMAYGPRRGALYSAWSGDGLDDNADLGGKEGKRIGAYVPPVRANNVFSSYEKLNVANEPGYYYFAVTTVPVYDGDALGAPVPLRLTLKVDGKAGDGRPANFTESDNPGAADPAVGTLSGSVLDRIATPGVLGFGVLGLGLIAAGVVTWVRRSA